MSRTCATLIALALPVLLTACGGDADNEDSGDGLPTCSDVWAEGETLPEDYAGCMDGDIEEVLVTIECADGSALAGHEDRYWALLGGVVKDAGAPDATAADPEYGADMAACAG